jgi:hypothetical protein
MKLLRTIPWVTRLLVGLFLVAQFAGMVSSPRANALTMSAATAPQTDASHVSASHAVASGLHHQHAQGHGDGGMPCAPHDHSGNPTDTCCALHACFAGLLPPVVAIATGAVAGEPLSASRDDLAPDARGGRLDRPPRPLH